MKDNLDELVADLITRYPRQGFILQPYFHDAVLDYAILFTYNGTSIHDPTEDEIGGAADSEKMYGIAPDLADAIRRWNQPYRVHHGIEQKAPSTPKRIEQIYEQIKGCIDMRAANDVRSYLETLGFEEVDTGGGCVAYRLYDPHRDMAILATDGDGSRLPDSFAGMYLGLYQKESEGGEQCEGYEMPKYKQEFPDFGDLGIDLPTGVTDESWHNNTCPSFRYQLANGRFLRIWIDHENPEKRELGGNPLGRFGLSLYSGDDELERDIVTTHDWGILLSHFNMEVENDQLAKGLRADAEQAAPAAGVWWACLDTGYTFTAVGRSALEARLAIQRGLRDHAQQYMLNSEALLAQYEDSIKVEFHRFGVAQRDFREVPKSRSYQEINLTKGDNNAEN